MTWVDGSGGPHSVGYALDGSSLIRNIDGTEFTIARRVDSVAFSQVGSLLTFDLEIQTYEAASVSRSLLSYLRALQ